MSGEGEGHSRGRLPRSQRNGYTGPRLRLSADISRSTVEEAMLRAVCKINYGNFKGSISDTGRHDEYLEVGRTCRSPELKVPSSGPDQYL